MQSTRYSLMLAMLAYNDFAFQVALHVSAWPAGYRLQPSAHDVCALYAVFHTIQGLSAISNLCVVLHIDLLVSGCFISIKQTQKEERHSISNNPCNSRKFT